MSILLNVRSRAEYEFPADTFITLMVEPPLDGPTHNVQKEKLTTTVTSFSELWIDVHDNPVRKLRTPAGHFSFEFNALISCQPNLPVPDDAEQHAPEDLPNDTLIYTVPSRYCQSDMLERMALSEFGDLPANGSKVNAVAEWIHERVEYCYSTTDSMTSAYDTATQRIGVCRDFAHLYIAFCRALGIPARYVSGYCLELEPQDFHAYAQVYLGGQWHNVDATFNGIRPALVPIAIGRDAADVAMTTLWGRNQLIEQTVEVSRAEG